MDAAKKFGVLAGIALSLGLMFFGMISLYTPPLSIDAYISQNISKLSSEKASMGGTFYLTGISSKNGKGTVHYEDGHMAYVADFEYKIGYSGRPSVTSFKIRPTVQGVKDVPKKMTVVGFWECLQPTSEIEDGDCKPGIAIDQSDGHYAIDTNLMAETPIDFRIGVKVRVQGIFTPIEQLSSIQPYDIDGIISATKIETMETVE